MKINHKRIAKLLEAIASARTNGMDDVDLVALVQRWQRDARLALNPVRPVRRTRPPRFNYQPDDAVFSIYKHSEGGAPIADHLADLRDAGIPCVKTSSPYIGQIGIRVARKHAKRADRILYGR